MTRIGLIRHGSTNWNSEGRAQGLSDIALNEDGIQQAHALAQRLSEEQWDVVYASDLARAKVTAEIVAERLGLDVQIDTRLREMSGGQIEGTTEQERLEKWGPQWRELDLGLESKQSGAERGIGCVEEIVSNHPGRNILIVTHGALLRSILHHLFPELQEADKINNTAITIISRPEQQWTCDLYNCNVHLVHKKS
ncbi:histidine phosphatase family protein [Paenibacillus sp. 481]|uniref:histidine phosphatase family protein n=1 Tax=Paenibacillus sp. 481 TaxID=2835869 RepID=UPI001E2D0447|nr:histidine phosphatase family protein [Paenibacillus sp. 481]UHA73822.1 histidine phosphatase family protein [Paenibacillus sp. 481]